MTNILELFTNFLYYFERKMIGPIPTNILVEISREAQCNILSI